ncbi:Rieske 2Fe-2S domain-containing protein [bacterium]|nr:Rieske 2Fe-2S domain-containing protein [bacterium]
MFLSTNHQPQILPRESYCSEEVLQTEIDILFQPSWHAVGLKSELPKDGSYVTFDLFGRPIILWQSDGEVHCFLNVCSHRYCKVRSEDCGTMERLRCQYHGWQFDSTGNVRKIPDAKTFRPLEQGMLGLKKYRAETCGELIFINLTDEGPSLRDFLGDMYETYQEWFSPEMHTAIVMNRTINANWKCLVENALESYHTSEVHPNTFGESPPEEDCQHVLEDRRSALTVDFSQEKSFRATLDKFGHWLVGYQRNPEYRHIAHFPNVMVAHLSLYRWVECVIPVSADRSISIIRLMCHVGKKNSLRRIWNKYLISRWAKTFLCQVGAEDARVLQEVQPGLSTSDQPKGGLISTREERVSHFQHYVDQALKSQPHNHQRNTIPIRYQGKTS